MRPSTCRAMKSRSFRVGHFLDLSCRDAFRLYVLPLRSYFSCIVIDIGKRLFITTKRMFLPPHCEIKTIEACHEGNSKKISNPMVHGIVIDEKSWLWHCGMNLDDSDVFNILQACSLVTQQLPMHQSIKIIIVLISVHFLSRLIKGLDGCSAEVYAYVV